MIAEGYGYRLFAARVQDGDHVHVFVSAKPKVCISEIVCMFQHKSAKILFEEFSTIKFRL